MLKPALTLLLLTASLSGAHAQSAPAASASAAAPQIREVGIGSSPKAELAPTTSRRAPRSAFKREVLALQEAGVAKVDALVAAMANVPQGPALEALHRQVEETKRETRLGVLRLHVSHAQKSGDATKAAEAQRQIDLMLTPPTPPASSIQRPAPGVEGGKQ